MERQYSEIDWPVRMFDRSGQWMVLWLWISEHGAEADLPGTREN